jgi:hypothetical protein
MYISILKCGPGLLFIGLSWPSVQVEFDMPDLVTLTERSERRSISISIFPLIAYLNPHPWITEPRW